MRSSTSNFSSFAAERLPRGPWGLNWLVAIALFFGLLSELEYEWGQLGHKPELTDSVELWAYHRAKVYRQGPRTVVLLGGSRINQGFSLSTFKNRFPDYDVVQLAVVGKNGVDALEDLSKDVKFHGIVICSLMPSHVWRDEGYSLREYIEFYHRRSLDADLNLLARTTAQRTLLSVKPRLALKELWRSLFSTGHLPAPWSGNQFTFDRARLVDYSRQALEPIRQKVLSQVSGPWQQPPPSIWLERAIALDAMAAKIQDRGGRVVFVRYPMSGEAQKVKERLCPKELFWDAFADATVAETIHFQDVPGLCCFECPDWSHLDQRDVPQFTNALLDELVRKGVLPDE